MAIENTKTNRVPPGDLAWVLLFGLIVFCFALAARDLWNPDEPRYARIAAEMIRMGDPVELRFNAGPYREKPPFYFWLIAGFTELAGRHYPTSWTALLPAALSAVACLLVVYWAARRYWDVRTAWMAVAITATSALFLWIGRRAQLDMTLTLGCTLALVWLYEAFLPGRGITWAIGAGIAMAVALLTKFHLWLPLLAGAVFLGYTRGHDTKRRWGRLAVATVVGLLVGGWWFYLVQQRGTGPDLGYQMNRVGNWRGHAHGPLYFFYLVPLVFLPWTVFAVELILQHWRPELRGIAGACRERAAGSCCPVRTGLRAIAISLRRHFFQALLTRKPPTFTVYCAVWAVVVFVAFTIPSSKRGLYILPMLPALGLLLARGLAGAVARNRCAATFKPFVSGRLLGVAAMVAGYALLVAGGVCMGMEHRYPWREMAVLGVSFLLVGAVVRMVSRSGLASAVRATAGGVVVLLMVSSLTVFPYIDRRKSAGPFCRELIRRTGPNVKMAIFDQSKIGSLLYALPTVRQIVNIEPVLMFERDGKRTEVDIAERRTMTRSQVQALGRRLGVSPKTYERILDFLSQPDSVLVVKADKFRGLPDDLRRRLSIVLAGEVSDDVYYVARLAYK